MTKKPVRSPLALWALALLAVTMLATPASLANGEFTVLFLGDSLTEGLGLEADQSFPSLIQDKLIEDGYEHVRIINAGISGSTTASGLSRLQWYIRSNPDLLVLSLGANDGLRGLSIDQMRQNLIDTIEFAKANGVDVALTGMMIPPNYGHDYASAFASVFPELAAQYDLPLMPFLLEGGCRGARAQPGRWHSSKRARHPHRRGQRLRVPDSPAARSGLVSLAITFELLSHCIDRGPDLCSRLSFWGDNNDSIGSGW